MTTIFCVDVEDFPTINTVYSGRMPDPHQPTLPGHEIS
jgi:hypothetical protein